MAKVVRVKKDKHNVKWEPYITVTLSKREAAGVQVLIGGMHCNSMRTDDLFDKIGNILDQDMEDYPFRLPCLTYNDSEREASAGEELDRLFGTV